MRKFYSFFVALLTVCSLAQAQVFFDATVTMGTNTQASGADQVSKDGVTISTTSGGLGTGQQYRFAKGSETTFTSTVGKITKIVFTCSAEGETKYGPGCFDAQDGYSYDGNIGTWTGSADEVKFIAGTAQVRAVTIAVSIDGKDPEGEGGGTPEPPATGTEVSCAQAVELTNALADGATSEEIYSVTGYITEIVGEVSRNQQTFWMADTKDGGRIFEAYWANLPEGTTEFKVGTKVKITGKLTKYVNNNTGKMTAEIKNATVEILEDGGETPPVTGTEVTCAQAAELTNALADGATSTETYSITGYITEVLGSVSRNQQTFWMADTKDGGKVFEAYWANLPEGVTEFKVGTKVKITGQLMKYVKDGKVTPEIKNATVEILEDGGDTPTPPVTGTEVTCVQAAELTNALADGGTSTETYTITGYITEVLGAVSTKTGTPQQSFWMADTKDGGKIFEAYYANVPTSISEFKVGMKVKITGQLMKYVKDGKVTPEIKNATVEILEDGGDTPTPPVTGTEVNCAQAVELTNALADGATSEEIYSVTGYITEVVGNVSRNQQTFWMADTKDGGNVFEAYWANLPEGVSEFKVGSKVKITGQLMKYVKNDQVTPEIKNATVEILEDGGDTPQPQPGMGEWESTVYSPLLVEHALELAATLDASTKSPQNVFVKGIISDITEINTQYGNATYYISDDGKTDKQLLVYRGFGLYGAKFEAEDALAIGDHVIVCGQIVNFHGDTPEFTTGSSIISLEPAAVSAVKADAADAAIYTINGQRVSAITRHGLYIVGGKKVVK